MDVHLRGWHDKRFYKEIKVFDTTKKKCIKLKFRLQRQIKIRWFWCAKFYQVKEKFL